MLAGADRYAFVAAGVEFVVVLQRNNEDAIGKLCGLVEAGRDIADGFLLLLLDLGIGLVDREVKFRRYQIVAPGFAYLVVVVEGIVVPREQVHCQHQ